MTAPDTKTDISTDAARAAARERCKHTQLTNANLGWRNKLAQWLFSLILRIWFECRYRLIVRGRANLPAKPVLFVANHTSSVDPPLLSALLFFRPISYLAKRELFESSPWGLFFFKSIAAVAVDREKLDVSTIKSAITVMKHGEWSLGIFPEGTRQPLTEDGRTVVGPLKAGAAFLARATRADIVPVAIVRMPRPARGRPAIHVLIGESFSYSDDTDATMADIRRHLETLVSQASARDFADRKR
ncbi:MAG: lysophospholipid acyltransferase family protein [Candidatus Melainabacteria bacterium]